MKQIISIILAALILTLASKDLATYVSFKINQEFIANNWCVNINKPELDCCGKCFLKSELEANNKKKGSPYTSTPPELSEKKIYYTHWISLIKKDSENASTSGFSYKMPISQLKITDLLRPPNRKSFFYPIRLVS